MRGIHCGVDVQGSTIDLNITVNTLFDDTVVFTMSARLKSYSNQEETHCFQVPSACDRLRP
jgi:hypothetical protein